MRVCFRTLLVPADGIDAELAGRAARRALFWIRRDAHLVSLARPWDLAALRRFAKTVPRAPAGAATVRHRTELARDRALAAPSRPG